VKEDLEHRWRDLGEFIRDQRRVGHLSLRKLSELAGISNPYLSQIERGLRKPSAEILQQIARALEISSETLYVRAGILEEREGADLVAEIRRPRSATRTRGPTPRVWKNWSTPSVDPRRYPPCAASPSSPSTPHRSPSPARATAAA
jgi:transcriptional regulator with XRE-family HTH domain